MAEIDKLIKILKDAAKGRINWDLIGQTVIGEHLTKMAQTPQNPKWHGEGDVLTHTKMVCEELLALREYELLAPKQRAVVFLSALLHDIGKPVATRIEEGVPTSPNHGVIGSRIARVILMNDFELCGDREMTEFREAVCLLIRYHSFPVYFYDKDEPERAMRRIASNSELTSDFSLKHLCILSMADVKGRLGDGIRASESTVEMCRDFALECGCYEGACRFESSFTAHKYYRGTDVHIGDKLYDDTWGEVIMMSGIPGTGKDTWISRNCMDMPMISLDEIRKEIGVKPTEDQTPVVVLAKERAKELLRQKKEFVWNATCLTPQLRSMSISLFESYGARVRIVYLETTIEDQKRRNISRREFVSLGAIDRMKAKMNPPERFEAQMVEWLIV